MERIRKFIESKLSGNIRAHMLLEKSPGDRADFPETMRSELKGALRSDEINSLYSHQLEAFNSISEGKNTLLVSHTASGKTLSFFLPVLNEYLEARAPFSVMLLYPTKALSRDQEGTLGKLIERVGGGGGKGFGIGTFDGDTPRDERGRIQRSADFLITNPDMLHSGILPNHNRKWKSFLSRLRFIIIDEVHIYRGAFGSHVSNVFRRLLRVCALHGSSPVFICSSATVGNPGDHVKRLLHRDFHVIDKDGAPRPERDIYFMNPSLVESHGHALYRKGTSSVSIPLIRKAVKTGIRTICFCRSRQEAERLYRAVTDGKPDLREKVKPYRGGLLPNERRKLEKDLAEGRITAIISTNALELGIDIGDLDLCILSGHPGSVASFRQQSGRVGRKNRSPVIVYIAKDSPIDQYLVHHPEFITSAPVEEALLNGDNPYILLQHLPCTAHEHPLREYEEGYDKMIYEEALEVLKQEKTVVPYHDSYRYALPDFPSRGVNLRGMTDYNIEIYRGTEVIGELDPIGARGTLYRDAIYQHLGTRYMSLELDLEKKLCRVEAVDVDYYTEAVWEGRVEMSEEEETRDCKGARLAFGYIRYNKQPKLYKKIRERSYENIGYGPITLPPFEYDTTGFSLLPPEEWSRSIEGVDKRYSGAALYGLSYILRHAAPGFCMADTRDIATDVSLMDLGQGRWKSALYFFDAIEGGVGYGEKIYHSLEECLVLCRNIITECDCGAGCPSCVPPLPPGVSSEELESFLIMTNGSRECTLSLLHALIEGEVKIPEIREIRVHLIEREAAPVDRERAEMSRKLGRAADIIKKKRERLH